MSDIETKWRDEIATAIKRAYGLGQLYLQQADSESYRENAKSDKTRATFQELLAQSVANADATIATKDAEIARLREALEWLLSTVDRQTWSMSRFHAAKDKARAALAQVAEVGNG